MRGDLGMVQDADSSRRSDSEGWLATGPALCAERPDPDPRRAARTGRELAREAEPG